MFLVQIKNQAGEWETASGHTNEVDRDRQYQMLLDRGVLTDNLRKTEDNE